MRNIITICFLLIFVQNLATAATLNVSTLRETSAQLLDKLNIAHADDSRNPPPISEFSPAELKILDAKDAQTWFQFTLNNDTQEKQTVYLSVPHILIGDLTLISRSVEHEQHFEFGTNVQQQAWPSRTGKFIVPLQLRQNESSDIYFRVTSKTPIPFQPQVGYLAEIENTYYSDNLKYTFLTGFIAALFLYILLAMLFTRQFSEYRYYLAQTGLYLIIIIHNNGWLLKPLMSWPLLHEAIYGASGPLVTIFQLLFVREFFQIKSRAPVWNRILIASVIVFIVAMLSGMFLGTTMSIKMQASLATPANIIFLLIAIDFWRRKYPSSTFLCVAYITYFVAVSISVVAAFGFLPFTNLMLDAYQFGIGLQLLLFGLAIANQSRIYRERETKMRVDAELAQHENQAKTSFLTHMSHELRTPLNGVIGMAQLLEKTELTQLQRYYSDTIMKSGNLLLSLINDVLDFTKISSGKLALDKHAFNFLLSLSDCLAVFIPIMMEKRVPVHLDLEPDCPQFLIADEYRIKQIIINLVNNALKFTEHGEIEVHIRFVPKEQTSGDLYIEVEDTGEGMDPENLEKIFSEFTQEDVTTTRRYGGTGLGLSIIKRIIELMDGDISVTSEKNRGSCFKIRLPVMVDIENEQIHVQRMQKLKDRRVLIAIEHPMLRDLLTKQLGYWRAKIFHATNDDEILKLLDQHSIDCIISNFADNEDFMQRVTFFGKLQIPTLYYYTSAVPVIDAALPTNISTLQIPSELHKFFYRIADLASGKKIDNEVKDFTTKNDYSHWRVLIVEDNAVNRVVAEGILNFWNIKADIAQNGEEAVRLFKQHRYPLIFMDCEMPIMDGYAATREIRALENDGSHAHIIALTAHALQHEHEQCFEAGMDSVITKPVTITKFQKFIESFHYPDSDIHLRSVKSQ